MFSVLNDDEYCELVSVVNVLLLDIFIEVSNEEEMECVIVFEVNIIGINNCNLCDFFIDLVIIECFVFMFEKVMYDYVVILELGIYIY